MKKKLSLILISLILTSSLYASVFNISMGSNISYNISGRNGLIEAAKGTNKDSDKWITPFKFLTLGVDTRIKLWFLEIAADINYQQGPGLHGNIEKYGYDHNLFLDLTAGPTFNILSFIQVYAGIGAECSFKFSNDLSLCLVQPDKSYKPSSVNKDTLLENLLNSHVIYKAGIGVKISNLLVAADVTLPTTFTWHNKDPKALLPGRNDIRVGLLVTCDLF